MHVPGTDMVSFTVKVKRGEEAGNGGPKGRTTNGNRGHKSMNPVHAVSVYGSKRLIHEETGLNFRPRNHSWRHFFASSRAGRDGQQFFPTPSEPRCTEAKTNTSILSALAPMMLMLSQNNSFAYGLSFILLACGATAASKTMSSALFSGSGPAANCSISHCTCRPRVHRRGGEGREEGASG